MSSAIDFIENDIAKSRWNWKRVGLFSILFGLFSAVIGLGMRGDFIAAFSWNNILPPLFMLFALLVFPGVYVSSGSLRSKQFLLLILFVSILGVSLIQPQTAVSLKKFEGVDRFWPEAFHCLFLGLVSSFIASLVLSFSTIKILPTPDRRWQAIFALVSGVFGLSVLTFHCMGPLRSHTVIAHWGQALLIFPIAYFQQNLLFQLRMKKYLGPSTSNISKLS